MKAQIEIAQPTLRQKRTSSLLDLQWNKEKKKKILRMKTCIEIAQVKQNTEIKEN